MLEAFQLRSDVLKAHLIGIVEVDLSTSPLRQVNSILPYSDVCWLMMPGVVSIQVGMVLKTTMRTKSLEIDPQVVGPWIAMRASNHIVGD